MTAYARSVDMDRVISEVRPASTRAGRARPAVAAAGWRVVGEDGQATTCANSRDAASDAAGPAKPSTPRQMKTAVVSSPPPAEAKPAAHEAAEAAPAAPATPTTPTASTVENPAAAAVASKASLPKRKPVDLDALLGRAPTRRPPRPKAPEPPDPLARLMSGEGLSHAKVDTQLTRLMDAWPALSQSIRDQIIQLMESSSHERLSGEPCDVAGHRRGRPSGAPGWRRFFHVLAGS